MHTRVAVPTLRRQGSLKVRLTKDEDEVGHARDGGAPRFLQVNWRHPAPEQSFLLHKISEMLNAATLVTLDVFLTAIKQCGGLVDSEMQEDLDISCFPNTVLALVAVLRKTCTMPRASASNLIVSWRSSKASQRFEWHAVHSYASPCSHAWN